MIRLDHWPMDLIVAANTGIAVSETGVIARAVKVAFCPCCDACRPVDHDCWPLPPIDDASMAVLDRDRMSAAPSVAARSR